MCDYVINLNNSTHVSTYYAPLEVLSVTYKPIGLVVLSHIYLRSASRGLGRGREWDRGNGTGVMGQG